ncbi:phosphoribosylformylglycinamidine synthase [Faecalicatena fissicatena]|uniref:Phosphoribosylformylglycinamidine synthase n=1 Tax=Faecalicatena fissicatena TaxID=290055 RepID=A0ABX2H179_9FIRM|nr:phosphoribosylformylglycinamidine synthase [Faecalicatena fissicatena]MCB5868199.1 phosphoribosylformylglycinamidine synthase [Faecalicatena fissicatena]NSD83332.1 phosphoribosylformylglycinamidine synthase [Faecalicatena fissicatena]NSE55924.1 phosphoribosylformylglycinamidine synthase [Faecalicatena fissicatena]NSE64690.1 phosphoribosylformylglycinamidine synthase [Faecalicatena fissicatena]NSG30832.1 phosphoribosylformylglycinamidine synthase [Faecalicatena fissicatena]
MSSVRRVYVEKKPAFAVQAKDLRHELRKYLGVSGLTGVRVLIRYDVENISDDVFEKACKTVFAEPPVDTLYKESFEMAENARTFSVEFLPGQFDQRADSAVQCVKFLNEEEEPVIRSATTYVIEGEVSDEEFEAIKHHCINPVDSREIGMEKPETLVAKFEEPADVAILDGFQDMPEAELKKRYDSLNLAMTFKDFLHIQNYFKSEEHRDPSMTEIRVLDTYWSDHCRHTTFSTELKNVAFTDGYYREPIEGTYQKYLADRAEIFKGREDKFVCLMDLALMAMRKLKKEGKLDDQEESDEINACSIVVPVEIDGKTEEWLVNFKNETHNHPTEIEPFGGAATCLGGAIRDPLSGRTYVYQAMRVTGAADPTVSVKETLKGKLPQKKLVREAAHGYSSYGNQIGLATGYVKEIYHPDYVAKRMEIGAVMGAAPRKDVKRMTSDPGDIIILLGGRTGRDGIGGATGSSKVHTEASIEVCGAEVQKGNAPTERKIQRMFRRPEVSRLIKKCNDFGAGGVSVAIGELADGLNIYLDKVPKKYAGLDGTEIAISESQERMAVVVDPKDVEEFLKYANEENLEAVEVAVVTESPRLVLIWRDKEIVNISRAFLDTNGAHQETDVKAEIPSQENKYFTKPEVTDVKEKWLSMLADLNCCSQKGLVEMFDSSIGAGSVLMPYGGKYQLTETQAMVAKLPVLEGKTDTVTMMSYGFDPYLSSWSPYHGAIYAVIESVSRIVAGGGDFSKIRFTFQEYFRRMTEDPARWSQPFLALLGAYDAQLGFGLPSIGGKDSMSGTFNEIDVPPTLVSFAVDVASDKTMITPELKKAGNKLVLLKIERDAYDLPDYEKIMDQYHKFFEDVKAGRIVSAYALDGNGLAAAVSKMAFGNHKGVKIDAQVAKEDLFAADFGSIVAEVPADKVAELTIAGVVVGEVEDDAVLSYGDVKVTMEEALTAWKGTLEKVFKTVSGAEKNDGPAPESIEAQQAADGGTIDENGCYHAGSVYVCKHKVAKPRVFIPVFPGTNCEYDSTKAFERAGAEVDVKVFKNLTAEDIRDSVNIFAKAIDQAQIIMFPGGFSAGDEPDGSAKFFATAFQNAKMKEAVTRLLEERDGLALGICNGFQALIKLGLVPYGKITGQTPDSPTLTYNTIGRHISKMVYTKVVTNKSPWLAQAELGATYCSPASHGEGRFVASEEWIKKLYENGQIATRYVDADGNVQLNDEEWNVNGSYYAIEGITSPDGRVLGKMAHAERRGDSVAINIFGEQDMKIFESGVAYFK